MADTLIVEARAASIVRDQGILNLRDEIAALAAQVKRTYEKLEAAEAGDCDVDQSADLATLRGRLAKVAAKPVVEPVE